MRTGDTIAAISSAVGASARMIVRLSGTDATRIANALCPDATLAPSSASAARLRFRNLSLPITLYAFRSPRSYTGEDLVEFHLPGNPLLCRLLLDELLSLGARAADPGEFTARAYFNGRIDLAGAEGVAATIAAHGDRELRAARQLLAGELARRLRPAMDLLSETLALIEVGIDFIEEDVTFLSAAEVGERIARIDRMLEELVEQSSRFERLAHEPRVVLVGRPNAGKSTLLNALAGRDRAVVSPVAGTTRDALTAEVALARGTIQLVDVAGLEPATESSQDEVDQQMRERALRELESADLVLLVHDATSPAPIMSLPRPPDLVVRTKADLMRAPDSDAVSAHTGENLDALRHRLDALAFGTDSSSSSLALNARHLRAIDEARAALARASAGSDGGPELVASDLREALDALGQVLGGVTPDDLLGRIFAAFCIGK